MGASVFGYLCFLFYIDGLTIGEKYYFRVAAITADGMSEYCEPVSKVAV